ncbi:MULTISPECIES: YqaJ viral recombinase family protein [unclassified Methylobacterium]|uniref:YqaJ viral recombinase family protein n=1 Tax=unclassified Methylobacterium TaxID=2615210 RepID=UPI0005B8D1A4|nr:MULTISPECIES: YqaJ viral recombinase family protein [unclassified Methylobacterium]SFU37774.1 YqaJ-like recombinase domain-containing protein [Methylobacterium sp. UNCCL125]
MALLAPDAPARPSTVRIHAGLYQGTEEWAAARCGMLTASEMSLILTPTLKVARNEKERSHLYELLAQRITKFVEPRYVSDDMLRGRDDEVEALTLYAKHYAETETVGLITNNRWGFTLGYSPDALVGSDGLVECKSRRQKYQIETWLVHVPEGTIPAEYALQIQTGLLVSERLWCDLVSYSGGLPLAVIRAYPDEKIQQAIVDAAGDFEQRLRDAMSRYRDAVSWAGGIPTQRVDREMI